MVVPFQNKFSDDRTISRNSEIRPAIYSYKNSRETFEVALASEKYGLLLARYLR